MVLFKKKLLLLEHSAIQTQLVVIFRHFAFAVLNIDLCCLNLIQKRFSDIVFKLTPFLVLKCQGVLHLCLLLLHLDLIKPVPRSAFIILSVQLFLF